MVSHSFAMHGLLILALLQFVAGHGTVTIPSMRNNPTVSGGWCPWCQGSQQFCENIVDITKCPPPSPCWGATGATVDPSKFNENKYLKDPSGNYWIDQNGGKANDTTLWCPGKTYLINTYTLADHNGAFRWESQLGNPGDEKEELFKNFTSWISVNNDPNTKYYLADGKTEIPFGTCSSRASVPWSFNVPHCRDKTWSQTNLTIPTNLPPGNTIVRWRWYGAMTTNQTRVIGPENSLFTNCGDVVIGNPAQCANI